MYDVTNVKVAIERYIASYLIDRNLDRKLPSSKSVYANYTLSERKAVVGMLRA